MGIAADALSIVIGSLLGSAFKERIKLKNFVVLAISIMIISLAGFVENIFDIREMTLKSDALPVVVFALTIGTFFGEHMHLDTKISNLSEHTQGGFCNLTDAAIFFGVGGLQICGPILLATMGDNEQLLLKSMIDFPFAMMFGISYGKTVSFAALPVALVQAVIAVFASISKSFFDTEVIKQLCALGYIILFFSGFNLICDKKYKINNVNMLIGIFVILLYHAAKKIWGLL